MRALFALSLTLSPLFASPARAQPEAEGPFTTTRFEAGRLTLEGARIPVSVFYPADAPGPRPVVAVVHGYSRTGRFMEVLARTLASHGAVALVPDMPCSLVGGCDHHANGRQLSALLDWAEAQGEDAGSTLFGRVDGARRGLLGHSFGGLNVFVAASQDPRVRVVVSLDPNDNRRTGEAAAPSVTTPSAHVMAQNRGNCNGEWASRVYPQSGTPRLHLRIRGSGHCDVEDPSDGFCVAACGSGDRGTSPLFRRYAVAFALCVLDGDPAWAGWVGGEALLADEAAGRIDAVDHLGIEGLRCRTAGPRPDAGHGVDAGHAVDAAPSDGAQADASELAEAGAVDAGEALDATGATPDADIGDNTFATAPPSSGCACTSRGASPTPDGPIALLLLAWAVRPAQRRRTNSNRSFTEQ